MQTVQEQITKENSEETGNNKKKINWANILIQRLENAGYRVYTRHSRLYRDFDPNSGRAIIRSGRPQDIANKNTILSVGGETHLTLETPEGFQWTAKAICSNEDNYCNSEGRLTALKKLLNKISYSDEVLRKKLSDALAETEKAKLY